MTDPHSAKWPISRPKKVGANRGSVIVHNQQLLKGKYANNGMRIRSDAQNRVFAGNSGMRIRLIGGSDRGSVI